MRPAAVLSALLLAAPGAALASPSDCAVARAARELARSEGLDTAPFRRLERRACGEEPGPADRPVVREDVWRLAADATYIVNIPSDTRILLAQSPGLRHLVNLPSGLVALSVAGSAVQHVVNLPTGLQALDLRDTPVEHLVNLPSGLRYLDIRGTRIRHLTNLPSGLECVVTDLPVEGNRVARRPRECGLDADWLRYLSR